MDVVNVEVKRAKPISKILSLPPELLMEISNYFSNPRTCFSILKTCKSWHQTFHSKKSVSDYGFNNVTFPMSGPLGIRSEGQIKLYRPFEKLMQFKANYLRLFRFVKKIKLYWVEPVTPKNTSDTRYIDHVRKLIKIIGRFPNLQDVYVIFYSRLGQFNRVDHHFIDISRSFYGIKRFTFHLAKLEAYNTFTGYYTNLFVEDKLLPFRLDDYLLLAKFRNLKYLCFIVDENFTGYLTPVKINSIHSKLTAFKANCIISEIGDLFCEKFKNVEKLEMVVHGGVVKSHFQTAEKLSRLNLKELRMSVIEPIDFNDVKFPNDLKSLIIDFKYSKSSFCLNDISHVLNSNDLENIEIIGVNVWKSPQNDLLNRINSNIKLKMKVCACGTHKYNETIKFIPCTEENCDILHIRCPECTYCVSCKSVYPCYKIIIDKHNALYCGDCRKFCCHKCNAGEGVGKCCYKEELCSFCESSVYEKKLDPCVRCELKGCTLKCIRSCDVCKKSRCRVCSNANYSCDSCFMNFKK